MASIFICVLAIALLSISSSLATVLKLERARRQHRTPSGFVNMTLEGSPDLYKYGFYFTRVKIGSPPREYSLLIDTGSELSWVSCMDCDGCETFNNLGLNLQRYSPNRSSSASVISCSDKRCKGYHSDDCNSEKPGCRYKLKYADDSVIKGIYVSDIFHLDTITNASTSTHISPSLTFGCTTDHSGIMNSGNAVDGILGLDAQSLSLHSQLSSPRFSHCLSGGEAGGGVLVFGEIMDPRIVYTRLYLSQGFYHLNLQSISLNGKSVQVDPSIFKRKNGGGTIVDSGTTLIQIAPGAYDQVINSLTAVVSSFAQPENVDGYQCFKVTHRILHKFPEVSFNFEGGASMTVQPKKYLMWRADMNNIGVWCLGFVKFADDPMTILGEFILQDKIIVYDLARKRLGWASHDCTKPYKVSPDTSSSSSIILTSTVTSILTLFLYLFMFD